MIARAGSRLERYRTGLAVRLLRALARSAPAPGSPPSAPGDGAGASSPVAPRPVDPALAHVLPAVRDLVALRGADLDQTLREALETFLLAATEGWAGRNAQVIALALALLEQRVPEAERSQLPTLRPRIAPVMNTWEFQNAVMQWDIGPEELVIDIGSGGWPFRRANHLADKYPGTTTHRVEAAVRDTRQFFEVDLEQLPFANGSYDFVFCSHVLEHMDNPGQAIREMTRIGRRGYIEVPTRLSDVMFNFTRLPDHHRWHGLVQGKVLVLTEWNERERRDLGNHFFDALQSTYENPFQAFFERNRDLFFASLHWTGSIAFLVIDHNGKVIDSSETPA